MNLNIKATGTREAIAAMLRELAAKLESGHTPDDAEEPMTEPIQIEHEPTTNGDPKCALFAEPKKKLTFPGHAQLVSQVICYRRQALKESTALPEDTASLLLALHAEFYGGPRAHANAFRILPRVVAELKRLGAIP